MLHLKRKNDDNINIDRETPQEDSYVIILEIIQSSEHKFNSTNIHLKPIDDTEIEDCHRNYESEVILMKKWK